MALARGTWTLRHGLRAHPDAGEGYGELDDADERLSVIDMLLGIATALGGEGQWAGTAFSTGTQVPPGEWIILDDSGFPHFRKTTVNTTITFVASSGSQDLYAILALQAGVSPDLVDEALTGIEFETVLAGGAAPANHCLKLGTGSVTASSFTTFTFVAGTRHSPMNALDGGGLDFETATGKYISVKQQGQRHVPAAAATELYDTTVFVAPAAVEITRVVFVPVTSQAGQNTNYATLSFIDKGAAGAGADVVGTKSFTLGVDLVAFDAWTDFGTLANTVLAELDVVSISKTETGTGNAVPAGLAAVEYKFV